MKKYSTASLDKMNLKEVTNLINKVFQEKFQGKTVYNKDRQINIVINRNSRNKARSVANKEEAVVLLDIIHVLENSKFINWDAKLKKHHIEKFPSAVAFINFNYYCIINAKKKRIKVSVIQTKKMEFRFQYSLHEHEGKK